MALETATYISQLTATNPTTSDDVAEGDDHLRPIKAVLKNQFSGLSGTTAISASEAELNIMDGVTSTATELNYNDITTLGTVQTSKAVTADSNGTVNCADYIVQRPKLKDYAESYTASSGSGSTTLDLANGNVFQHTASGGNVTFVFSNPPGSGNAGSLTLKWIQDSSNRTITWPTTVDWAGGSAPDVTSGSAKVDVYTFFTVDGGTIWYGFQSGADMG